jgi:hypothetical protein
LNVLELGFPQPAGTRDGFEKRQRPSLLVHS